jgi:hypothetical protein
MTGLRLHSVVNHTASLLTDSRAGSDYRDTLDPSPISTAKSVTSGGRVISDGSCTFDTAAWLDWRAFNTA